MLVTLKSILKLAEANKNAIGAFNTPNLESLKAVISAAEELEAPVIIMHAQLHEEMGICKMEDIAPIMCMLAEKSSVPVCVHLDHGTDIGYVRRALDLGFTSVMYDGSEEEYEVNLANTSIITELASKKGISVEAEVGCMGSREGGISGGGGMYTDPETARHFVCETGIDALACAFGTVHGIYRTKPRLDLDRLSRISGLVDIPLVMHGGSGVSEEDYREVISRGVRKINYYTYMANAGVQAVKQMGETAFYHDVAILAENAMKENTKSALRIFGEKRA